MTRFVLRPSLLAFAAFLLLLFVLHVVDATPRSWVKHFGAYPSNSTGIIRGYGYPCEDHLTPTTSDGWKLHVQNVPHGLNNANGPRKGVVFFQHGLLDSSAGVNTNPPYEGLVFILADAGYDVWLGNSRGNGYSTINTLYSSDTTDYWNFSFDEMASIDLPTQIEYVLQQTGQSKLTYIGHSEGTIVMYAGLSATPSLSQYINLYIALAPVAYVQYVESDILKALALLDVDEIFELLDDKSFYLPGVIDKILPGICTVTPGLCKFAIDLVAGPTTFFNETREDYYLHYFPATTSVKNIAHWAQGVREGTFTMFDYGESGNIQHYNQPTPPQYELSNFPTQEEMPMALFAGGQDYLADPKDVQRLLSLIPSTPLVHYEADYAHLDPLIGENAFQRIYPMILQMIDQAWDATAKNQTFVLKP